MGVFIVGFADNVILTVSSETIEEMEMLVSESVNPAEGWIGKCGKAADSPSQDRGTN